MDKLDGVPLTDLAAISSMTTANPEAVLISALNTWTGSLIACQHFHADVHAGLGFSFWSGVVPRVLCPTQT